VRKNLATWTTTNNDEIQLLFQPEQSTNAPSTTSNYNNLRQYNASIKQNCCVGCGAEQNYMKHYIVPFSYRTLFPDHFKTHLPHDICILCPDCHLNAQQESHHRMHQLEREERLRCAHKLHPTSHQPERVDSYRHKVQSAATALLDWRHKLPPATIDGYERLIQEWGQQHQANEPLEQLLQTARQLQSRSPNPHYVSGAALVVDSLKNKNNNNVSSSVLFDEEALAEFVRDWRRHFLQVVRPHHLPTGWSVDAPVQSDRRTNNSAATATADDEDDDNE